MKRMKSLRLASILLMLCLATTCAVSGTFAKYVTSSTANDSARVAKWGITMDATGSLFEATYDTGDPDQTVESKNGTDKVVAPGTSDTETYEISGAPEVDYQITFAATGVEDIILVAGAYTYVDTKNYDTTTINVADSYYPIAYTVTLVAADATIVKADDAKAVLASGVPSNFTSLVAAMDAISNTVLNFDANEEAAVTLTIEWSWAFHVNEETDAKDTLLGDVMAANPDLTWPTGAEDNTNIAYTLKMTATQIGD